MVTYDETLDLCWCSVCVCGLIAGMLQANGDKQSFAKNSLVTGLE